MPIRPSYARSTTASRKTTSRTPSPSPSTTKCNTERTSGFKKTLLAGYHVNTITVWQSGKPFSILNGGGGTDNTLNSSGQTKSFGNRATARNNGGNDRPNQIGDARSPKTDAQFFNTAAFAPQPVGTIGSAERNSLFGPDFSHVDVSLFKDFTVTERLSVQFRAEAFDVTNTPASSSTREAATRSLATPPSEPSPTSIPTTTHANSSSPSRQF